MGKNHALPRLLLAMVWVSIAAEIVHLADGRLSPQGDVVLQAFAAGLVAWGLLDRFAPAAADRLFPVLPLAAGALGAALFPFRQGCVYVGMAALFGLCGGALLASALAGYLAQDTGAHCLRNAGFACGVYAVVVYPFALLYDQMLARWGYYPAKAVGLGLLLALALWLFFLRRGAVPAVSSVPAAQPKSTTRDVAYTLLFLFGITLFAGLQQVLTSGILETMGGTRFAPRIFALTLVLRTPTAVFIGWLLDAGRLRFATLLPLSLMMLGSALSLFLFGTPYGEYAMLTLFDIGGDGFIYLLVLICMQGAVSLPRRALVAGIGAMVRFVLVGFFNINTLGITPALFAGKLERPLIFAILLLGVPMYLLIVEYLLHLQARHGRSRALLDEYRFTAREREILAMLARGLPSKQIARELFISEKTVRTHISNMLAKTGQASRVDLVRLLADITPPIR